MSSTSVIPVDSNTAKVSFNISWDNSWRITTPQEFWDASWVFVKYKLSGNSTWYHLNLNESGHTAPDGSEIVLGRPDENSLYDAVINPYVGAFIHRSAVNAGTGTVNFDNAEFSFSLPDNNLVSTNTIDVSVFAIEMVYVPEGEFYVGSGGVEDGRFHAGGTTNDPFRINSQGAITIDNSAGNLFYAASTYGGDQTGTTNAAFPAGYSAFYMMKYSITQGQYVDFLNTLTQTQATARKYTGSEYRYAIIGDTVGSYDTTNPYVAMNYMSWPDGAAYAAWAGLRLFTELEFEKACRGPVLPVADEYAWGTAAIANAAYTLGNAGALNEGIAINYSTTAGNASYDTTVGTIGGPLRVGIFAAHANNSGRITSGASYWGIMELSGNLWERPVTVGDAAGRNFTGLHGNGILSANGNATVINWPGLTIGEVTDSVGSGFRGGNWVNSTANLRVSDRYGAAYTGLGRSNDIGFRAARSAPAFAGE